MQSWLAGKAGQAKSSTTSRDALDSTGSSSPPVALVKKRKNCVDSQPTRKNPLADSFNKQKRIKSAIDLTQSPPSHQQSPARKKKKQSQIELWEAPWPDLPGHEAGPSQPRNIILTETSQKLGLQSRKGKEKAVDCGLDLANRNFWDLPTIKLPNLVSPNNSQCHRETWDNTIIQQELEQCTHSLVRRILDQNGERSNQNHAERLRETTKELWTSKYAPKSAQEVLGSTSRGSALTLRDWLLEHEITIRKKGVEALPRRQVMRKVEKTKRKRKRNPYDSESDLDDFIVYDDSSPIKALSSASPSPVKASADKVERTVFDNLTNLILLVGPIGTGKTAAVYAAANELGWQTFEVSPGSGRRSPKELLQAVGDVGRNHIVWRKDVPSAANVNGTVGLAGLFTGQSKTKAPPTEKSVTQSLILLEEVDILFQDDKSHEAFWEGVEKIVAQSLRPVVMTCNDISRIPLDRLAIQTILHFEAPEDEEALAMLQAVASVEGAKISKDAVSSCWEKSARYRPLHQQPENTGGRPPLSLFNEPLRSRDLRRAVLQLQFEHQHSNGGSMTTAAPLKNEGRSISPNFNEISKVCDILSATDAYIARRPQLHLMDLDGASTLNESELEIGCHYLKVYERTDFDHCLLGRNTEADIEACILASMEQKKAQIDQSRLERDRTIYMHNADTVLSLLNVGDPYVPQQSAAADLVPMIVAIARADDICADAFNDATRDGSDGLLLQPHSPVKRRSRRLKPEYVEKYERHLACTDEQLAACRALRLDADNGSFEADVQQILLLR